MQGVNFLAGQASLWVQVDGPNTEPAYLGCHSIGDIPEPKGDSTLLYCPDPSRTGKFVVKNSFKGEPGTITTSIETDIRPTADLLEDLARDGCPFPLFVHKVTTGRRDVFNNFERSFVLRGVDVTQTTLAKLASRTAADEGESTQSFDLSVQEVLRCFNMQATRISMLETEDVQAIAVLGQDRCEGGGLRKMQPQDSLFATTKHLSASAANVANVIHSSYEGTWASTAANPQAAGMDLQGCVGFLIAADTVRIIVARGTTVGGHPAVISYSDDEGVTWHEIHVGSVNGEFMSSPNALFALDRYNIWFGSNLGRIYKSSDGGLTWTLQENAAISATAIVAISFVDDENGMAVWTGGQAAVSVDSGLTWAATTVTGGSTMTDCAMITQFFLWAVGSDGMRFSMDGGTVWNLRSSDNVAAIDFLNDMFGIAVGAAASGVIWMTIDGGYDWLPLTAIPNSGLTNVEVVNSKLAYVTGKTNGGTGFIAKVTPV
jgi:photosystem II stability/assembly factor-like uncharacterized protein